MAVRAAHDATLHAKAVLVRIEGRGGSRIAGTVALQPIGSTRTRVTVTITNPGAHPVTLSLVRGSDCNDNRHLALAQMTPLTPVSAAQPSRTIVEVPLSALRSGDYAVAVRDATTRRAIAEACAPLNR